MAFLLSQLGIDYSWSIWKGISRVTKKECIVALHDSISLSGFDQKMSTFCSDRS